MKNLFVTTMAALAVATGSAFAAGATKHTGGKPYIVLWNQDGNFGGGVNSQVYESAMGQYDDYVADDFVVPNGQKWVISEIDVTGTYTNGSGPASSVSVIFYHNKNGRPSNIGGGHHSYYFTLSCTDNAGSFQCALPTNQHNKPVVGLRAGTWWVSVYAHCDSQTCGTWDWTENTSVTGNQAVWENPGGAWKSCGGWEPLSYCFGGKPADLAFKLIGLSRADR